MNYFNTAARGIIRQKGYLVLYVLGLSIGIGVVLLDSLWINDELTFNQYHKNYSRIAQVMHHDNSNGQRETYPWNPVHLGELIRADFPNDFKNVVMSTPPSNHIVTAGLNKFNVSGNYMSPGAPAMLTLEMEKGNSKALNDPSSILISESLSKMLFGTKESLGQIVKVENMFDLKVEGVYADIPANSDFADMKFVAPWNLIRKASAGVSEADLWQNNSYFTYVEIADNTSISQLSTKIKDLKNHHVTQEVERLDKSVVFLHPMSQWHLYGDFSNGVNVGGRIEQVRLFAALGLIIMLLACVNYVNLSTANAQSRAKEIGIRKTIGSLRKQLFMQFLLESTVIALISWLAAVFLVCLTLPFFNDLTQKHISFPWTNAMFWTISIGVCLVVGFVSGLYPAMYLSSLKPIMVLKGTFKVSQMAVVQRKTLVVFQFCSTFFLMFSTFIIYKQIQFSKNRSTGYQTSNLITLPDLPSIHKSFAAFRNAIIMSGACSEVAESANSTTDWNVSDNNFSWTGKDPNSSFEFPISNVTAHYGGTIGWKIIEGRDFSSDLSSDSSAFVINESAVKIMGFRHPIGQIVKWHEKPFHIIGVIKNIIFESPYIPVKGAIYEMTGDQSYVLSLKMSNTTDKSLALAKVKEIFQRFCPEVPFDPKYVAQDYEKKFDNETRIGKLCNGFAILAMFVSALGLLGLAILMTERRIKEIGIRKVLGSSILNLWALLSKEFLILLGISILISVPVSYYLLNHWLENYPYHTGISWLQFGLTFTAMLAMTFLSISFNILKAAFSNPTIVLRKE